jgi:serine/threonine protein kinase/tetratricopeptide (TPR) repeat protein
VRPERFARLKRLLREVIDLPRDERKGYLDDTCKDDPELRRQVESLLEHEAKLPGILKTEGVAPPPSGKSLIGQTISHYRILDQLGVGGMGVVYKAEDTALKRIVALKFLPPELTRDPAAKARFAREAEAAAALDHTNICTVHEIGYAEGRTFIAMAYVEGPSLKELLEAGPLELDQAIDLSAQIAKGLKAAHDKGIVHRDIKPANVMVTPEGRAEIADFGLAKFAGRSEITTGATRMGTVSYMSPEQARGDAVDHRTDIWSLGAMLYEMSTGQRPFRGDHDSAVIYSILNEQPEPMTSVRGGVPQDLQWIVDKAIAKSPEERYQTTADMLADLEAVKNRLEAGTTAGPLPSHPQSDVRATAARSWAVSLGSWGTTVLKRHKVPAIMAAVVIAVGLAGILSTLGRRPGLSVGPNRVVVAAFENRTGDESLDYLGPLTAGWITEGLSHTGTVEVVPTETALHSIRVVEAKATGISGMPLIMALARHLESSIVVSGSYHLMNEDIQFQATIVDAQHEKIIGALSSVVGPRDDPTEAIAELRQRIMGALVAHLDPSQGLIPGAPLPKFEAYREYMAGLELFGVDFSGAARHFRRAAELDSTFAAPYFRLVSVHTARDELAKVDSLLRLLDQRREELAPVFRAILDAEKAVLQGRRAESLRYLHRASELLLTPNPTINYLIALYAVRSNRPQEALDAFAQTEEPLDVVSRVYGFTGAWSIVIHAEAHHMLGNYQHELELVRRAQEYYPDVTLLLAAEARALAALGQVGEVQQTALRALSIGPGPWGEGGPDAAGYVMLDAARELRAHGHPEFASELVDRAIEWYRLRMPDARGARDHRFDFARALHDGQRWEEAHAIFEELASEEPRDIVRRQYLGILAARRGDRERAQEISNELQSMGGPYVRGQNTFSRACIASALGDREQAVSLLRQAFSEGHPYQVYHHCMSELEPLWDYRPFQELIRPKG